MVGALYDLVTTIHAVHAGVIIDIPLRSITGNDAFLDPATGTLTVTYAVPFLATPTVQITGRQSLGPGGNIVIVESDATHFKVAATAIAAATVPAQDGSFISTAAAKMPMQNAVSNLGGKWNNTTQRFVTLAGSYTFSVAAMTTANAANGAVAAYLYKNGTEIARSTATGPSGTPITAALSVTVAAADNDDFEAYCSATPSGMTVLAAGSYFTANGQGRVNSGSIDYFVQGYGGHA
jgi:hypothetical protein